MCISRYSRKGDAIRLSFVISQSSVLFVLFESSLMEGTPREDRILLAVQAIRAGQSYAMASEIYAVPKSTLYDHVRDVRKKFSKGRTCVFSEQEEKEFAKMLKSVAQKGYSLTPTHCRKAAYLFAEFAGYKHNFNHDQKMAGRKWFSGFIKRNNIKIVTRDRQIPCPETPPPPDQTD